MNNQKLLLRIVQTWDLNPKIEHRGFRCANCQKYLRKAWYYWLNKGSYITPVHFCNKCETKFKINKVNITKPIIRVKRSRFSKLSKALIKELKKSVNSWDIKLKPVYKALTCDDCGKNMRRAYHIWFLGKGVLSEVHFCRECGKGIVNKV